MRLKNIFYVLLFFGTLGRVYAQPGHGELEAMPHHLMFNDRFERLRTVKIINFSEQPVSVDSLSYDESVFNIHLNDIGGLPVSLASDEFITFDVLMYNYFNLFNHDSSKVIYVYNSGNHSPLEITVKLEMDMMGEHVNTTVNGFVSDGSVGLADSRVYFFYDGNFLIDSTITDAGGNYSAEVPDGNYFIAAYHENYYMQFAYGKSSLLDADFISVDHEAGSVTVDFVLEREEETNISISGAVVDNTNDVGLAKSVVIITTGKHTPTKRTDPTDDEERTYSVITNSDGSYVINNILGGSYYIQAYSGFLTPGYFNEENQVVHLWQDADSIDAFSPMNNKDVFLEPDSAYGGGEANGAVFINGGNSEPVDDVLLYAVSTSTNKVYSYNFSSENGNFFVNDLPYGTYKLISERVGYETAESEVFEISQSSPVVKDITLTIPVTAVEYIETIPSEYSLNQNYPNPFSKGAGGNPTTVIEYSIPKESFVNLSVYNILGQKVAELVNDRAQAGRYQINWNASQLVSGIYFYTLRAGDFSQTKKMIILK